MMLGFTAAGKAVARSSSTAGVGVGPASSRSVPFIGYRAERSCSPTRITGSYNTRDLTLMCKHDRGVPKTMAALHKSRKSLTRQASHLEAPERIEEILIPLISKSHLVYRYLLDDRSNFH